MGLAGIGEERGFQKRDGGIGEDCSEEGRNRKRKKAEREHVDEFVSRPEALS
jgi:hypothetical protein